MLVARVATALVGVPIVLLVVWVGGPPLWCVATLAAARAGWEASHLLWRAPEKDSPSGTAWALLAAAGAAALVLASAAGPTVEVAVLALALLISLVLSLVFADATAGTDGWSSSLAALIYTGLPLALLVSMRAWPGETSVAVPLLGSLRLGAAWVLLTLTAVWAIDTAAYAVGRLAGRHRLWPRVSPNKTWEGTTAGVLAGVLVCVAWAATLQMETGFAIVLGLAVACAAVLGDLAESAMKRTARVKDAGGLLPGHGGVLDRIDGLAFSSIVVFLGGILRGSAGAHLIF